MQYGRWKEAALLFAAFVLASRDVERTLHQRPVSHEQTRQFQEWLKQKKES